MCRPRRASGPIWNARVVPIVGTDAAIRPLAEYEIATAAAVIGDRTNLRANRKALPKHTMFQIRPSNAQENSVYGAIAPTRKPIGLHPIPPSSEKVG